MSEPLTIEPDRIIMRGEWVEEIIFNVAWSETENIDEFNAAFEIDPHDYLAAEGYYQGCDFTRVIRRRSDGRTFGYSYWSSPGNDAYESTSDPNGEDHGFEVSWDNEADEAIGGEVYVWLPAEPFVIVGYRTTTPADSDHAAVVDEDMRLRALGRWGR